MSSLTRRVHKLEGERLPDAETSRRNEELLAAIEEGRKRVLRACPGFVFNDDPMEPAPLLPNGKLDLVAVPFSLGFQGASPGQARQWV
jgi:hypothetical protein